MTNQLAGEQLDADQLDRIESKLDDVLAELRGFALLRDELRPLIERATQNPAATFLARRRAQKEQ